MVLRNFLSQIPFFSSLSDSDIIKIQDVCLEKRVEAGEVVFAEGSAGDSVFIVAEGSVEIWKDYKNQEPVLLSVYGPGQIFGELAIIDDFARSATVVARQPANILCITRDDFNRIARPTPITLSIMRSLSVMVRERTEIFTEGLRARNRDIKKIRQELKAAREACSQALRDKELLLRQMHYRLKDNMQIVTSLLNLRAAQIHDEKAAQVFQESRHRINTLATVYEFLCDSPDISRIEAAPYLEKVVRLPMQAFEGHRRQIRAKVEAPSVFLTADAAFPVGLIVNELVSNAFGHAFPNDGPGQIRVVLTGNEELTLSVSDDGMGMSGEIRPDTAATLGLHMVRGLAESQLGGCLEMARENTGTCMVIRFPAVPRRPDGEEP